MIVVMVSVVVVTDATSGEKERGTLETLLTFPLKNSDIVMGKFIATTIASAISSTLGFLSMYGMLFYLSKELDTITEIAALSLQSILVLIALFAMFSMFISAIAIILSTNAKSFKEAQNSTQPLSIVSMIPMFASIMGVELNKVIAFIPFMNISLLVNQALLNKIDMGCFVITVVSGIVYTYVLIKVMSKLYKSDKILFN
jgi:sodium transport system permease protein